MQKNVSGLKFTYFKPLCFICLLFIHLSCASLKTRAPEGFPCLPEENFSHYPDNNPKKSYIVLPKKSKDDLRVMLEGVLRKLHYIAGSEDFKDKDGFKMSTGFHIQGEDDPLIPNLVVSIALVFEVYMQAEPKLEIRYAVAWSRKKESKWHYDKFDSNLQQYIQNHLDKLDQKIAEIKKN
jgi:hypothetical protein